MKSLFFLFSLTPLLIASETAPAQPAVLKAVASQQAIYIYWGRVSDAYPLILSRRSDNGPFQKIASITPISDPAQIDRVLRSAADPLSRSMRLSPDFVKNADADRATDEGLSQISTGYAQVRGYGYLDRNVEPGCTYHYRLTSPSAGEEKLIGEVEATAANVTISAPADVKAENNKDGMPLVEWSGQPYTTFEVSRSDKPAGTFTKITLLPLVATHRQTKLQFVDRSAVCDGRIYYYRVLPLDLLGEPGEQSKVVSLTTLDRTPPRSPSGLRIRATPGGVQLSWERNQEADLAGYRLYRAQLEKDKNVQRKLTESRGELISAPHLSPDTTQYEDTKAEPGNIYSYRIAAVDKKGNESPLSPPILASPKSRMPPEPPTGLAGEVSRDGQVLLTWNPSKEKQVYAYHIYRGLGQQGKLAYSTEVISASASEKPRFEDHLNLGSQEVYRYAVSAVDITDNESSLSDVVTIKLSEVISLNVTRRTPQAVPVITGLTSGDRSIEVAWSAVPDKNLAGYNVYRSQKSGAPKRLNDKLLPPRVLKFRDSNSVPGTRYDYFVSSVDGSGNESARSEPKSSTTFTSIGAMPPSGLHVKTSKSKVYLSWQKPPNAAKFIVYFSHDPRGLAREIAIVSENSLMLPRGAPPGWYAVQAVSEQGSVSPKSAAVRLKSSPH